MGVRATEVRKGTVIEKDGDLLVIIDYEHKTPGNLRAIINIKTKSLSTGSTNQMRLGSGDILEVAFLDKKSCEYLYRESDGTHVFMDSSTYEQFPLSEELVGDQMGYVRPNTPVVVTFHGARAIGLDLPGSVVLSVTHSEPAVKGNTATNVKKEVVVETGLKVKVPIHIGIGDQIAVNTQTGEFVRRVND